MYDVVLALHSLVRWVALALGLVAAGAALASTLGSRPFGDGGLRAGRLFAVSLDVQLLLGLLLYLVLSPITSSAMADFGGAMGNPILRFWIIEHPTMMVAALALAHIGVARVRRASPASRPRQAAIFFSLALLLLVVATPWPFSTVARPLVPLG